MEIRVLILWTYFFTRVEIFNLTLFLLQLQ